MNFLKREGFDPEFSRQIVLFIELKREVERATKFHGLNGDLFVEPNREKTADDQIAFSAVYREIDQPLREACESLVQEMLWKAILNSN